MSQYPQALTSLDDDGSSVSDDELLSRRVVPPALYLPTTGGSSTWGAEILLHQANDGRLALLAYTALDRLARCMGPHQPWVLYPTERLGDLDAVQPYQVIYLDMEVPRELWRQPGQQGQQGQAAQQEQPGPAAQTYQPARPAQQAQPAQPAWTAQQSQPYQPAQQAQPGWPAGRAYWQGVAQ